MSKRFKYLTSEEINMVNYYTVKKLENKDIKELMVINQEFNPRLLKISESLARRVKRNKVGTRLGIKDQNNLEVMKCMGKLSELADIKSQLDISATPDLFRKMGALERDLESYNKGNKSRRVASKKPTGYHV